MDSGEKVSSNGGSCISINDELCIHGYVYVIYIYTYDHICIHIYIYILS